MHYPISMSADMSHCENPKCRRVEGEQNFRIMMFPAPSTSPYMMVSFFPAPRSPFPASRFLVLIQY